MLYGVSRSSRILPFITRLLTAAVVLLLLLATGVRPAYPQTAVTYSNPVIAQNLADPSIIKALDGYYYIAATSDYWNDGSYHILPIFRSSDLVHWTYVEDALTARPGWADSTAGLWAPDLQYFNHRYYMYYMASATNTQAPYNYDGASAIGALTSSSMTGPWTDAGAPIVPPRQNYWTFDPAEFVDQTGQRYLYYGSFYGGTLVQRLAPDGLHTTGPAIQIGHWDRYEGTYVVRHDVNGQPYYYNFSSTGNCCQGPNTAYSVVVNRATSPTGTFADQNGYPMLYPGSTPAVTPPAPDPAADNRGDQGGGYPTLKQNGNKWGGVGGNGLIADLSGQQWILYHGVDRTNGWLSNGPNFPITFRQDLLDRLDWTADGWPVVNGGSGPSESNTAPDTTPLFGDNFNTGSSCAAPDTAGPFTASWYQVAGLWKDTPDLGCPTTSGGYVSDLTLVGYNLLISNAIVPAGTRTECDVRLTGGTGDFGCISAFRGGPGTSQHGIVAYIDAAQHTLVAGILQSRGIITGQVSTTLPANFDVTDWHHLAINEDLGQYGRPTFEITLTDRDRDPLGTLTLTAPADFATHGGSVGFYSDNALAEFDNISAAPYHDNTVPGPAVPAPGAQLSQYSDDFNGASLNTDQWTVIRPDPSLYAVGNGSLSITVNGDLYQQYNTAKDLIVENQPQGNYVVETRLTFDPRDNFQQAGLLIYSDDDHYIKIGPSHQFSLNKIISGRETLEPAPPSDTGCSAGAPLPGSNVAVTTYTHAQCPNEGEGWDYLTNPQPTENGSTAPNPQVTDYLRIYRTGDIYTPYSSLDGVHWVKGSAWTLTAASPNYPVRIGVFAFAAGGGQDIPARFDYVHVYSEP